MITVFKYPKRDHEDPVHVSEYINTFVEGLHGVESRSDARRYHARWVWRASHVPGALGDCCVKLGVLGEA